VRIKAIIAEDERLAREDLAYLVGRQPDFEVLATAEDGEQLLQRIDMHQPDVIFLDIQMPVMSGMEVTARLLEREREGQQAMPLVVFTTAYDEFALQAFAIDAIDYLLKPYDMERFNVTIERIRKRHRPTVQQFEQSRFEKPANLFENSQLQPSPPPGEVKVHRRVSKILVDDGDKVVVVAPDTILYAIRAERNVEVHTTHDVLYVRGTLSELAQKLSGWPFFRTHRGYLVNLDAIREITPWLHGAYTITLCDQSRTQIPVSRSSAKDLFQQLMQ